MSATGTPKASQAAITAVQEALAFHVYEAQDTDCRCGWRGGRAEHQAHVAVAAADAAAPHNAAQALRDFASELDWKQPEKACDNAESCCGSAASCDLMQPSVRVVGAASLRDRADRLERGA